MTPQDIQFLFTLRYNPYRQVSFKEREVLDFIPGDTNNVTLEYLLKKAVFNLVEGKDKVAISLSAGVDSNLVLALLQEVRPDIKIGCFCADGAEVEETRKLAANHRFTVVTGDSVIKNIPQYVKITNEPRWNVYHHRIAEEAKSQGYDLLLTGDGGDELFGGYVFRYQALSQNLQKGFAKAHLEGHKNDYLLDQGGFLKNFKWDTIYSYLERFRSSYLTPIEATMWADFNGKLVYDLIPTTQAISKFHKIDIKSPFLVKGVVDYALRIDAETKLSPDLQVGKIPLRQMLEHRGIKVSDKKMGFTHDLVSDWNGNRGKNIYLHPKTFDIIEYKWFEHNSKEESDYRIINKLTQIICLSEWFKLQESQQK